MIFEFPMYPFILMHFHFAFVGCPFRHSDPELLKQKLQFYKVSPNGISQVGVSPSTVDLSNGGTALHLLLSDSYILCSPFFP